LIAAGVVVSVEKKIPVNVANMSVSTCPDKPDGDNLELLSPFRVFKNIAS
jgi:hypothetical protein